MQQSSPLLVWHKRCIILVELSDCFPLYCDELKHQRFGCCILRPSQGVTCLSGIKMIQPGKTFLKFDLIKQDLTWRSFCGDRERSFLNLMPSWPHSSIHPRYTVLTSTRHRPKYHIHSMRTNLILNVWNWSIYNENVNEGDGWKRKKQRLIFFFFFFFLLSPTYDVERRLFFQYPWRPATSRTSEKIL